ncbi:hypothetical protein AK812_SmicGene25997 [Symbiodinium microadriaticum]|uniref:(S)-ureidoglycine aminohydrolase cupin domain-containing protein n=1 Tax=Symbiodinium microadriaticum TaxID=2951 RepID=A0A1Q9DAN2_SYMMI|nr:hypothetical protein AK812_SmicGene25997 [Symbiodinium microadriaticum]CAE7353983.1 unnamed protein product [Symbiodinium sp. KB8]
MARASQPPGRTARAAGTCILVALAATCGSAFVAGRLAQSGSRPLLAARVGGQGGESILVERQISQQRQEELGTSRWASWQSDAQLAETWPVTYADPETVFILSGSATVTPEGGEAVTLLPGDLASFPPGRTFIWKLQSEPLQLMRGIRTQGGQIVAEKLLKDVVPEGAPQEIISATSKKDEIGHRIDIIEYAYQWKFDDAMARQLRRKKFQLHCKAAVVVSRKKQFVLTIASEENRWPIRGDDYQIAIDTFKLTY